MAIRAIDGKFSAVDGTDYTVASSDDGGEQVMENLTIGATATSRLKVGPFYRGLNSIRNVIPATTDRVRNRWSFASTSPAQSAQVIWKASVASTAPQEICAFWNTANAGVATVQFNVSGGNAFKITLKSLGGVTDVAATAFTVGDKLRIAPYVTRGSTNLNGDLHADVWLIDPGDDTSETLIDQLQITGDAGTADINRFSMGSAGTGWITTYDFTGVRMEDGVAHEIGTSIYNSAITPADGWALTDSVTVSRIVVKNDPLNWSDTQAPQEIAIGVNPADGWALTDAASLASSGQSPADPLRFADVATTERGLGAADPWNLSDTVATFRSVVVNDTFTYVDAASGGDDGPALAILATPHPGRFASLGSAPGHYSGEVIAP